MSHIGSGPVLVPEGADALITPPDVMREGLQSLSPQKDIHPVETIQKTYIHNQHALHHHLARHLYGQHFVDGLATEQMALAKLHSTGVKPSLHALEISMNLHTKINPEDVMSLPAHSTAQRPDTHTAFEHKYNALQL